MPENGRWQNYREEDLPPNASPALREAFSRLDAATEQTRRALNVHYLFIEMKRTRPFAAAVNNTRVADGANVVASALIIDLIIKLASLFDRDPKAIDLRRIINSLLRPEHARVFEQFHASFSVPYDAAAGRARLNRYRKMLGEGKLGAALRRIVDLRNQGIAHLDQNPSYPDGRPWIRDTDYALAAACAITWNANAFAVGRFIDAAQVRKICRGYASSFTGVILKGINADKLDGDQSSPTPT
jgi:hypothetical protein